MSDFKQLLCETDPEDAAGSLLTHLSDLITASEKLLLQADKNNAEALAGAVAGMMGIASAVVTRLDEGIWELQRLSRRGFFSEREEGRQE